MSSVVLWKNPHGRIVAAWHKDSAPTVTVYSEPDYYGICYEIEKTYHNSCANAVKAAQRRERQRLELIAIRNTSEARVRESVERAKRHNAR